MKITLACLDVDIAITVLLGIVQLCLSVLGVYVSFTNPGKQRQLRYILAFVFLGLGGIGFTVAQQIRNAEQSDRILKTITGGDSFCYVYIIPYKEMLHIGASHRGEFPLHNIEVHVIDFRVLDSVPQGTAVQLPEYHFQIPELAVGTAKELGQIALGSSPHQTFEVMFYGPSGYWDEIFHLQLINGRWASAFRVIGTGSRQGTLIERVDPSYPLENGKVRW